MFASAFLIAFLCLSIPAAGSVQPELMFDAYFTDSTMRVDYYHMADKTSEFISIDKVYKQGTWAGNPDRLIDNFNNGKYYIKVYHAASGKLIYSHGFTSYCFEYMTTDMAAKGIKRTYHETALIPFPKQKVRFTLENRDRQNRLKPLLEQVIDPCSVDIVKESLTEGVTVIEVLNNGNPHQKVDLAFIAEGYTKDEEGAFKRDLKEITAAFFDFEPYKSHKQAFNVYGLFKPSQESGSDQPTHGIFKKTAVGTTFNAMGLYRYNLTEENRALHDIAAHVPYDTLVVMVNSSRYGGGGIYNTYCIFSRNPVKSVYLFLHEFGHSFAGLADEYYSSRVVYNEFFTPGVEPTEPNITALLDPAKLKWKHLVTKGTKIPTPWGKDKYDKMSARQKRVHRVKPEYRGIVGAFEGAGYASTGLYRPSIDCLMHTSDMQPYCKVCEAAILRMIEYYTAGTR
jgi:hypothetical protein